MASEPNQALDRESKLQKGTARGCSGNQQFDGFDSGYKRMLWVVIVINAAMFLVEMSAAKLTGSQVLQADALDFLGDAMTYGLSLAVWFTVSAWPDLLVAFVMAGLFLRSAHLILTQAWAEYRSGEDLGALESHGHDHAH